MSNPIFDLILRKRTQDDKVTYRLEVRDYQTYERAEYFVVAVVSLETACVIANAERPVLLYGRADDYAIDWPRQQEIFTAPVTAGHRPKLVIAPNDDEQRPWRLEILHTDGRSEVVKALHRDMADTLLDCRAPRFLFDDPRTETTAAKVA